MVRPRRLIKPAKPVSQSRKVTFYSGLSSYKSASSNRSEMMASNAFITGADRGLGYALSEELLKRGWRVYAGQYDHNWPQLGELADKYPDRLHIIPLDVASSDSTRAAAELVSATTDHIDLLVNNAGVLSPTNHRTVREPLDYPGITRQFDINTLGPLRIVEAFLPLTDRGALKRLCFVSSEAGSITKSYRTGSYGYCMSKTALNMAVKLIFNQLRPEGYTFRLYHPGWMRSYMAGQKNMDAHLELDYAAVKAVAIFLRKRNEDRLVLVDYLGHTWPW
jgi:NAD(P)-dependent dehydrogenase (short-subunit alcohol dehydrogenase family)